MIEVGGDTEIRGPFADQPLLVRIGCRVLFAASILLGAYIPISASVAVIGGVGTPAPKWWGDAAAFGLMAAMAAAGAWTNGRFLGWLRGGALSPLEWCCFNGGCIAASAGVASAAVLLHIWPPVMAAAVLAMFAGAIASVVLIRLGQALDRRSRKRPE